jgi:hypothetical protein
MTRTDGHRATRSQTLAFAPLLVLALAACSSTPGTPVTTADAASDTPTITLPGDAHASDTGTPDARGPTQDATITAEASPPDDATTPENEAGDDSGSFDANFGDVIMIGPPPVDASCPDAASDAPKLDACGICDRVWNCNGFPQVWVSMGPDACKDTKNMTILYCENGNTIGFPDPANNYGSWMITSTGLALDFNGLSGTMEIDCTPGC